MPHATAQQHATYIVRKLRAAGHVAYFAGGWVRDYLMGHPSEDIDIATDAPLQLILDLFPQTYHVGIAFGVIIVAIAGHHFEVATFRQDIDYSSGRRPRTVVPSTPQEDAARRDFTINGMFYDPLNGQVIDYVGGAHDLQHGLIKAIGNPYERFFEDRLRMLRAVRFAARFGFTIDAETEEAIAENAELLFPAVAVERVWQELQKMSAYPFFDRAVITMHRLGLLQVLFPPLAAVPFKEIKKNTAHYARFAADTPTVLYIATLFPEELQGQLAETLTFYKTANSARQTLDHWIATKRLCDALRQGDSPLVRWTHFLAHPLSATTLSVYQATLAGDAEGPFAERLSALQRRLAPHVARYRERQPLVSASLLLSLGIAPGKLMGQLLAVAEELAIENDSDDSQAIVAMLRRHQAWPITPPCGGLHAHQQH